MARRLIFDIGFLVSTERRGHRASDVLDADDDMALAAITVAELRTGVEMADGDRRQRERTEFLLGVLETLLVVEYDVVVAEAHGRLLAHVRRSGRTRSAHDLIVAATAIVTGRTIITTDRRARFEELPNVSVVHVG